MVRKDIESLYIATCDIYDYQKTKDKYGVTEHQKWLVLEKQRCRLSYKNTNNTFSTDSFSTTTQVIKLFIAPELEIKPGSYIEVTQHGRLQKFKHSGVTAIHANHQEIILELNQEKA